MAYNQINVVLYDASYQKLASSFHSGNEYLDQFLKDSISLDNNFGKTYVLLTDDNKKIVGYYNLGVGYIEQTEYGIRRKIGGAVHINCFALDREYQGTVQEYLEDGTVIHTSDFLLLDCMEKIKEIRVKHLGFTFVILSSTEEGYHLYLRNGFEKLDDDISFSLEEAEEGCIPMYYAIDVE